MMTCSHPVTNQESLREFVELTMSEHFLLEIGVYPITERILWRGDKACGIFFCLHGPRSTKFTAIWEMDRNQILFYGASGERFQKTQLAEALQLERIAA